MSFRHGRQYAHHELQGALTRTVGGIVAILLTLSGLATVLIWFAGPPHLPETVPSLERIGGVLGGSTLPNDDAIYLVSSLAWLTLGYLVLSVGLRVFALVLLWCRGSTPGIWRLLRLSDLLTLPPIRRLTDGAVAGLLVASSWLPVAPRTQAYGATNAAVLNPAAAMALQPVPPWTDRHIIDGWVTASPSSPVIWSQPQAVQYTVVAGDNLWAIAQRFYGDGDRYREIYAANAGTVMTSGEVLSDPAAIRPGWVLTVPMPAANVIADAQGVTYRVQGGDSLWRIAERFLGDGLRWPEIWELNRGRDMGGGRAYTNPSLIPPGWTLYLPVTLVALEPQPSSSAPRSEESPTLPAPEPPLLPPPQQDVPIVIPEQAPSAEPAGTPTTRTPGWSPEPLALAAGAAGLAAAGAAVLLAWRARSAGSAGSASHQRMRAGRERRKRRIEDAQGDVERVHRTARLLRAVLVEHGFAEAQVLTCREAEDAVAIVLGCPPGDSQAVVDARFALARRLGCTIAAQVGPGHRAELTISGLRREAIALFTDLREESADLLIVPVGADDDGVQYLNLAAAGSVWLAGTDLEVAGLLRGWLVTLAAGNGPDIYELALDEPAERLLGAFAPEIGHRWQRQDAQRSDGILAALEAEFVERTAGADGHGAGSSILAIVADDAALDGGRLETLVRRGRTARIYPVLVHRDALSTAPAPACGASVRFSHPSAADDTPPGALALTIRGAAPITLRPVLVQDEHVPAFNSHHGGGIVNDWPATSGDMNGKEDQAAPGLAGESGGSEEEQVQEGPDSSEAPPTPSPTDLPVTSPYGHPELEMPKVRSDPQPPRAAGVEAPSESEAANEGNGPVTTTTPVFTVRCFGAFEVMVNGQPVTNWKVQKARELLAYLLVKGGAPVPREEAWEALWPEQDIGQMQRLLSDTAYHLRRALKEASGVAVEPVITQGQRYHLQMRLFRVDILGFEAHLRRAAALSPADALVEYDRALTLHRGSLFGSEPFDWAGGHRHECETKFIQAAHAAARLALASRDIQRGAGFYRAILAHDPIDEEAARGLMHCYGSSGDINGVRKVYKTLVEALRRELDDPDADPLPETTHVLRRLVGHAG